MKCSLPLPGPAWAGRNVYRCPRPVSQMPEAGITNARGRYHIVPGPVSHCLRAGITLSPGRYHVAFGRSFNWPRRDGGAIQVQLFFDFYIVFAPSAICTNPILMTKFREKTKRFFDLQFCFFDLQTLFFELRHQNTWQRRLGYLQMSGAPMQMRRHAAFRRETSIRVVSALGDANIPPTHWNVTERDRKARPGDSGTTRQ